MPTVTKLNALMENGILRLILHFVNTSTTGLNLVKNLMKSPTRRGSLNSIRATISSPVMERLIPLRTMKFQRMISVLSLVTFFKTYKDAKIAVDMIRDAILNSKKKSYKTWMPRFDQGYYFITGYGEIKFTRNTGLTEDDELFEFGNFFKTNKDAKIAANLVRDAFSNSKKLIDQERTAK